MCVIPSSVILTSHLQYCLALPFLGVPDYSKEEDTFCFLLCFCEPDVLDKMFLLASASYLLGLLFVDVYHHLVKRNM